MIYGTLHGSQTSSPEAVITSVSGLQNKAVIITLQNSAYVGNFLVKEAIQLRSRKKCCCFGAWKKSCVVGEGEKISLLCFFPCVLFSALSSRRQNVDRSITKIKEGGGLETEKNPKKKTKESFEAEIRKINLKKAFAKKK